MAASPKWRQVILDTFSASTYDLWFGKGEKAGWGVFDPGGREGHADEITCGEGVASAGGQTDVAGVARPLGRIQGHADGLRCWA